MFGGGVLGPNLRRNGTTAGHKAAGLVVALLLPLGLTACRRQASAAPTALAPTVEVSQARSASTEATIVTTGLVQRRREVALAFRVPGVLTAVNFEPGDHVKSGQLVAMIDPTALAARRKQSQADLERIRRELDRDRRLNQSGFVSQQQLENQQMAFTVAAAADESTRFDEGAARLSSPVSGDVLQRSAQAGEVVQTGQLVLKVADAGSPFILRAPLSLRDAAKVRVGDPATVHSDTSVIALSGRITRVGDAADPLTGTVLVEIELEPQASLRSGEAVRAELTAHGEGASRDGVRIPAEALIEGTGDRASVFLLDRNSTARRTAVQFLGLQGEDALVRGIALRAEVITAGGGFIRDGDHVRVLRSPPPPSGAAR